MNAGFKCEGFQILIWSFDPITSVNYIMTVPVKFHDSINFLGDNYVESIIHAAMVTSVFYPES